MCIRDSATLALAAFVRVRALRARCGPFGPAVALKRGLRGDIPPAKAQGMCILLVTQRQNGEDHRREISRVKQSTVILIGRFDNTVGRTYSEDTIQDLAPSRGRIHDSSMHDFVAQMTNITPY